MLETQSDRAERRGIEKGKLLGIERGKREIEKLENMLETQSDRAERRGIEKGKQLGEKDMVKRLLLAGFDEQAICKAAQLSTKELAKIKSDLDRD